MGAYRKPTKKYLKVILIAVKSFRVLRCSRRESWTSLSQAARVVRCWQDRPHWKLEAGIGIFRTVAVCVCVVPCSSAEAANVPEMSTQYFSISFFQAP